MENCVAFTADSREDRSSTPAQRARALYLRLRYPANAIADTPIDLHRPNPAFERRLLRSSELPIVLPRQAPTLAPLPDNITIPTNAIIEIAKFIAKRHKISLIQIRSPCRTADLVEARFTAIFMVRYLLRTSLHGIGLQLNRDHTAVLHALRVIEKRVRESVVYAQKLAQLELVIRKKLLLVD